MERIKLALIQMKTGLDRDDNLQKAEDLVTLAAGQGADVAVLPEMFPIPYVTEWMRTAAEPFEGETLAMLRRVALANGIHVLGGSFPEAARDGRCFNTSVFVGRDGEILATYRKTHLFDVDWEDLRFMESDVVLPGNDVVVFDTEFGRAGIAICYDLRFPGLFRRMAAEGARIVFVPAVFNPLTGPVHWEVLNRARALDHQLFVAACSPAPDQYLPYKAYGHSLVVDPWARVLGDAGDGEGILYVDVDFAAVETARRKLPLAAHGRPKLYQ